MWTGVYTVLCVIIIVCIMNSGLCFNLHDADRLLTNKTTNYRKQLRPLYNQSEVMKVYINLDFVYIQEFDESRETITITSVIVLNWHDDIFTWKPEDYNNMTSLTIDTTNIWIPTIISTNSIHEIEKVSENWHILSIVNTGEVIYHPERILSSFCILDVTYFPLDRQACYFFLSAWGFTTDQIRLVPLEKQIRTTFYTDNGAWTLVGSSVTEMAGTIPVVSIKVVLERKPLFLIVNVLSPLVFMTILNMLVFLIPTESGERMSFCITVLLAIAVFLTLVGDNLPRTSSPISLYSCYLFSVLIISLCITFTTIMSLHFYHKEEEELVGSCWTTLIRCLKCKRSKPQKRYIKGNKIRRRNSGSGLGETISSQDRDLQFPIWTNPYGRHIFPNDRRCMATAITSGNTIVVSWKDVSRAIDKMAFIFFLLVITLDSMVFTILITEGLRNNNKEMDSAG